MRHPVRSRPRAESIAVVLLACLAPAAWAQAPSAADRCTAQLLVGWPEDHRANLEARLRDGTVAVRLQGCSILPVDGCRLGGGYQWRDEVTPAEQAVLSAEDAAIVGAPPGAILRTVLAGRLHSSGELRANNPSVEAACSSATHLIARVDLGEFELRAPDGNLLGAAGAQSAVPLRAHLYPLIRREREPTAYVVRSRGLHVTGITFTTLGGMAIVTGITFTAIGCSDPDRGGMCTAGLITLGTGALITPIAIWMIVAGAPRTVYASGDTSVVVGPTFVTGTF